MTRIEDEWLWGWDTTPGIVSVHAEPNGRAFVWRRLAPDQLVCEEVKYRPWLLLSSLEDLQHLGSRLVQEGWAEVASAVTYRELSGDGALRFLVQAEQGAMLEAAVLKGARKRTRQGLRRIHDLGPDRVLALSPEEQYLVASGRTYYRDLEWEAVNRVQFDLETTGLDPARDRIFLVAVRSTRGEIRIIEPVGDDEEEAEAALIEQLVEHLTELDPDVIENHNLHGFDLPFLIERARRLRVRLSLGRHGMAGFGLRVAATGRGVRFEGETNSDSAMRDRPRRMRYTLPGRELIDSLDAVRRHDFAAREFASHGLKAVAKKLGLASADREYISGAKVHQVYLEDPERVRRYAAADVTEAAGVARLLGSAAFALARMVPRRYERIADAGPATGIIDPLLVRAYLHSGTALPTHQPGDGTVHHGAALYLFATGVAQHIVKADVASLYPSLMRQYRIGPARDHLGVMLALIDRLVEQRLAAKQRARELPKGTAERFTFESLSAAMKLVINSAYGYLGAVGLTRFADVHAANEVTRHGRELLALICRELDRRGMTLLEADTDGVYFAVPEGYDESAERRIVAEVAALLPELVHLEFEGRYAAMLSHEPKNYALKPYGGPVILRGVAFRSSRAEPLGEAFLRRALEHLLAYDLFGVRQAYVDAVMALRKRSIPTAMLTALSRLTKTSEQYLAVRERRREFVYEALLRSGRRHWEAGEMVRVYRAEAGRPALYQPQDEGEPTHEESDYSTIEQAKDDLDPRDYDVEYYVQSLRTNFASRLERSMEREHFEAAFAEPRQLTLFSRVLEGAKPLLLRRAVPM